MSRDTTSLQTEMALAEAEIARLQMGWPDPLELRCEIKTDFYFLPRFLVGAFPTVTALEVHSLSVFCRLFAGSILLQDRLVDGACPAAEQGITVMRVMAMQAEAYRLLHRLFSPSAAFWARAHKYLADHAGACIEEHRFISRARPLSEYTEELGLRIAIGKNGLCRLVAAALVELAHGESLLQPLLDVLNGFTQAVQMWDDIEDWKDDLRRGAPSVLLCRVISEPPADLAGEQGRSTIARLAREIYYGGHAGHVLDLALAALDAAEGQRTLLPNLAWDQIIGSLRQRCQKMRRDLDRIVGANLRRARTQRRIDLKLPDDGEDGGPWLHAAWDALRFLLRQWQLGFGEARDLVRYPREVGFGDGETCYSGDVFQRALIIDALADSNEVLGGQLIPLIAGEACYLLEQRCTSNTGGWRYFPDLPELPPDADVLAQVMQALLRANRRAEVAACCERPLAVLLRDLLHPDGSFETWIVPEIDPTPEEQRHAVLVENVWGSGPDSDVIPNLLYGLHLYDPERFAAVISHGVAYIESQQMLDGTWMSRWYDGPHYAVHVCLRLLAAVQPNSPCVARALRFLRRQQRPDGSWGVRSERGDALSTSLALLGLAAGHLAGGEPADHDRARHGLEFLKGAQDSQRSWATRGLINVGMGQYHGSRTLTTSFVLRAALGWHRLTAVAGQRSLMRSAG